MAILYEIQLVNVDISMKIMKEPIFPNFLPLSATFPVTMQKYITVNKEIVPHMPITIEKSITLSLISLKKLKSILPFIVKYNIKSDIKAILDV